MSLIFTGILMTHQIAKSQVTFQKIYGTSRIDYPIAMQLTSNGGIIMAGNSFGGFGVDTDEILIVKTDSKGDTLWTRVTTVSGIAEANSVIQSSDGGFLIAGNLYQISTGLKTLIIKTDSNGNFLWARTVGDSANQIHFAVAAMQMSSGNYLVAGTTNIGTELISITDEGDIIWTKVYYGINYGALSMCRTSDGNYVIVGPGDAGQADHTDLFEMKVDSDGNVIWAKEIGTSNRDYVKVVAATSDNGTIIGAVTITPADDYYMLVIKTDSNGAYTWTKLYEGPTDYDEPASIHQTSDGGYIISGTAHNVPYPSFVFLIRTGSTGLIHWVKTFQGENNEVNYSVQIANDRGYVIANGTQNFGAEDFDYHLIRTDSTGNSNCNGSDTQIMVSEPSLSAKDTDFTITPGGTPNSPDISFTRGIKTNTICSSVGINAINAAESLFSIFPNPATNSIHLQLPSIPTILSIFNLLGEKMKEEKVSGMNVTMDVSELPAGLYFVRTSEKMVGKFVKE